jgi:hypothetical protein
MYRLGEAMRKRLIGGGVSVMLARVRSRAAPRLPLR